MYDNGNDFIETRLKTSTPLNGLAFRCHASKKMWWTRCGPKKTAQKNTLALVWSMLIISRKKYHSYL